MSYSADHSNNGYCLPFVSTCYDRKHAKNEHEKAEVANEMVFRTNKQLHQGNHNTQDFGEEDAIELEGYLGSIKELLKRIYQSAMVHTSRCKFCKKDGGNKVTVQPLHRIVGQVDMVLLIVRLKIDASQIFVSQRACDYFRLSK